MLQEKILSLYYEISHDTYILLKNCLLYHLLMEELSENVYSLFTIVLCQAVSFKHATQMPAREVFLVRAINMHVLLCYFETGKHFSNGDVFV